MARAVSVPRTPRGAVGGGGAGRLSRPQPAQPFQRPPPAGDTAPGDAEADAVADAATQVLRRFRVVFNAVKTHFREVERQAGIGGAQLWALSVIAQRPGLGVNQLAAAIDVHQTTASNLVRGLLARGLVEAKRDGLDRRTVQLHALAPAAALLDSAPGPLAGVLPDALAKLPPDALRRLGRDLDALIAVLAADERAARIPLAQM